MRIHLIACRVLSRELNALAAQSDNIIDLAYLPQGLHDVPNTLRKRLKQTIDELYQDLESGILKNRPDAIALGYGLCSNGVLGLEARDIPLVIPKTDDCIALFLGSQKRYLDCFETMNGTYWLNSGWIESCGTLVRQRETREQRWQMYAEKYGEDNADFLIEQEGLWVQKYDTCAYIRSDHYHSDAYERTAQRIARDNEWSYTALDGSDALLSKLLAGDWNEDEFLVCPPGYRVEADYTEQKLKAVKV